MESDPNKSNKSIVEGNLRDEILNSPDGQDNSPLQLDPRQNLKLILGESSSDIR